MKTLSKEDYLKTIKQHLEQITRKGYDFPAVFTDWLKVMLYTFQRDDERYQETVSKYTHNQADENDVQDCFAQATTALLLATRDQPDDYLGELFTQEVSRGKNGQFFTPSHICNLMALLSSNDLKDNQTVLDPTCGSGRTLLASTERNPKATFVGMDIDERCVLMSTLNLLFRNVNGFVIWQNTLTSETWGGYATCRTPLGGIVRTLSIEQAKAVTHAYESQEDDQAE